MNPEIFQSRFFLFEGFFKHYIWSIARQFQRFFGSYTRRKKIFSLRFTAQVLKGDIWKSVPGFSASTTLSSGASLAKLSCMLKKDTSGYVIVKHLFSKVTPPHLLLFGQILVIPSVQTSYP